MLAASLSLGPVLVLEGALASAAIAALLGSAAVAAARDRRNATRLAPARAALSRVLGGAHADAGADAAARELRSLPMRLRGVAVTELAASLGGADRRALGALGAAAGLARLAARSCRSPFWWKRLRGVRIYTAIGAGADVVPRMFHDRSWRVRDEAIEWAAVSPSPEVITALVAMLGTPELGGRFALRDTLLRLGAPVVPALERQLAASSGVAAVPALEVAAGLPDARFATAAIRLCEDAHPATRARAALLLGSVGGDDAVREVARRLDDAEPEVRASALRALAQLGHWPAAPAAARLLRDRSWAVRREAGLALRAFGSPGRLLLRRALDDADRFAADMARQVLDRIALEGVQ